MGWSSFISAVIGGGVVAILAHVLQGRRTLRELRNREVLRIYEELIEIMRGFAMAAIHVEDQDTDAGLLDRYHTLLAKTTVARIHSGGELTDWVAAVEKLGVDVYSLALALRHDATEQAETDCTAKVAEFMGKLELLPNHISKQLGPTYVASRSWWHDFVHRIEYERLRSWNRFSQESARPKHRPTT